MSTYLSAEHTLADAGVPGHSGLRALDGLAGEKLPRKQKRRPKAAS